MKNFLLLLMLTFPAFSQTIQIDSLKQALAVLIRQDAHSELAQNPDGKLSKAQFIGQGIQFVRCPVGDPGIRLSAHFGTRGRSPEGLEQRFLNLLDG